MSKARLGPANGMCALDLQRHRTWKPIDVPLEVFAELLDSLHQRRLADKSGRRRPYLRWRWLPRGTRAAGHEDLKHTLHLLNTTTFGHPDRYMDRVSKELLRAMGQMSSAMWAVAVSIAVRYKCSPRGLAQKLAAATSADFEKLVREEKNADNTYRQLGSSKGDLAKGVLASARTIAAAAPYRDWEKLEDSVALAVKKHCAATTLEHFCARQVAADLCRRAGFVRNLAAGARPKTSRLGPGAQKGWYFAELAKRKAARNHKLSRAPERVAYRQQTVLCEYSKLVKRFNFPLLAKRHLYIPSGAP